MSLKWKCMEPGWYQAFDDDRQYSLTRYKRNGYVDWAVRYGKAGEPLRHHLGTWQSISMAKEFADKHVKANQILREAGYAYMCPVYV